MNEESPLTFSKDIRPLFTDLDVAHMKPTGIDLDSHDSVVAHADAIYGTVSSGAMPPKSSGEPPWTQEMCALFKRWQTQGCPP
jgi:uncharacterized membrane protein